MIIMSLFSLFIVTLLLGATHQVKSFAFTPSSQIFSYTSGSNDQTITSHSRRTDSNIINNIIFHTYKNNQRNSGTALNLSDWSSFNDLDDEDDDLYSTDNKNIDNIQYADENDSQEYKAEVGSNLAAPEVDWFGDPIFVPQGSTLPLTEDNVQGVLAACREEIGTLFGYSAENRGVGITGGCDFVGLDGPIVILKLKGRFWHQRTTVLDRVGAYIIGRIPEVIDVIVDDEWELSDEANDIAF